MKKRALAVAALWLCAALRGQTLPGTQPLASQGDLAAQMVEGIDRFLMRGLAASVEQRRSISPNRDRLRKIIGLVDQRVAFDNLVLDRRLGQPALVATGAGYKIYAVRWPVLEGVDGEGLLLEPDGTPVARVVAAPDADQTPEIFAGLVGRRLAENGCEVLIPVLIDRKDTWSGKAGVRFTNQPHREFVYRMAYEMGRHVIGYEVQKVLAAVDWFARAKPAAAVGVIGYGEGGLLALYSAAADTHIDATVVSGYFQRREGLWREPIYRNVWGLLREFGDAELAGLVAPRTLIIDAAAGPEVAGPPPETRERRGAAPGRLVSPARDSVRAEFDRAKPIFAKLGAAEKLSLVTGGDAVAPFLRALGVKGAVRPAGPAPTVRPDDSERLHRQFQQLVDFTQGLVRRSEFARRGFWSKADASSIARWQETTAPYGRYLWEEVIGKLPAPTEPMRAQTRRLYDQPRWIGYEVLLPVGQDVFAYGILLIPKDLKTGERRPVVVTQHGLEGRPQDLIDLKDDRMAGVYGRYAARLADRGFVVYAPQNPYIGGEKFRVLLRKAHPLKLSLFSFILGQYERTLEWLSAQPFVDPARIGFYGLSYGGKTAVRVPPLLDRYALSICSADFNEWIWKITDVDHPFSYMYTRNTTCSSSIWATRSTTRTWRG